MRIFTTALAKTVGVVLTTAFAALAGLGGGSGSVGAAISCPPQSHAPGSGSDSNSDAGSGSVSDAGSTAKPGSVWTWPLAAQGSPTSGGAADSSQPVVLRPFEPPLHRWDSGHRGVDLGGYGGEAVVAAGAGVVLYAGYLVDRPVVVVGHGELRTTYEPVAPDPSTVVGERVARGQRIGTLQDGHCATTACLHWGLVTGHGHAAVYYDPLLLLGCGAVRLKPLPLPLSPAPGQ